MTVIYKSHLNHLYYILISNIKQLKTLAAILNHPDRMYKDGGKIALEWISRFEKTVSEYVDSVEQTVSEYIDAKAIEYVVDSKKNTSPIADDSNSNNNDFLIDI